LMDENKKELVGLFQIQLEAIWKESGGKQSKELTFDVLQQH